MISFAKTVSDLKNKLEMVDSAKIKDVDAVYQFKLTGDDSGVFHVIVENGKPEVIETAHDDPNITVTMATEDFKAMLDGKLSATSAFMAGKLKIKGDISLAIKLQGLLG